MEESRPQAQESPGRAMLPDSTRVFFWGAFLLAIVVVLGFMIVPNFISYRQRGYGASPNADVKNAYTSSQAYFSDYPKGSVDAASLVRYGYIQTPDVVVVIQNGTYGGLSITAKHNKSTTTYTVDSTGKITKGY